MPDLAESLSGRDLGYLRIIADQWGIELGELDASAAFSKLISSLVSASKVSQLVNDLPADAKAALLDLARHAGRIPWAQFTRTYGTIREMGPSKRDRERPYITPISVVETLWYKALVARAFFDTPAGPEEFAYIPDDLLALISPPAEDLAQKLGRQASAAEYAHINIANDQILDQSCTLLAAKRTGYPIPDTFSPACGEILSTLILYSILVDNGLLDQTGMPQSEPVRVFLETPRGLVLARLLSTWKQSARFNELSLLPHLLLEGNWANDPIRTRQVILGFLSEIPKGTWWSLGSLIAAIKQRNPDFQRPSGDYDSWFIRDTTSGEFLRGFEHWDDVDGRLIRFILTGPLHWLGILDLACPKSGQEVTAFRLSGWSADLLAGKPPKGLPQEDELIVARSDARLSARRLVPRSVRYQLTRFCEWEKVTPDEFHYRISSASLTRAREQGLTVKQLLTLLDRHTRAVPPSLIRALERWDKLGCEARMEKMVVLRVASEDILLTLKKSRAGRYLGETLGPTTVAVKPGAIEKVIGALAELGYLGEIRRDVDGP